MLEKNGIEPYIIKAIDNTSIPTVITSQKTKEYANASPLILEYFLHNYIIAREGYSYDTFLYDYNKTVKLFSSPEIFQHFKNKIVNNKTVSPITQLGQYGKIDVKINQVVPQTSNSAFIFRIAKITNSQQYGIITSYYQINIRYTFDTIGMTYEMSMINPLGLKVTGYEILEEKNLVGT